jgi:hypothetical protein
MKKFPGDTVTGYIALEDTTCEVYCECVPFEDNEDSLWVSSGEIVRCPKCGRGYKTEFIVWQYEPGETDS